MTSMMDVLGAAGEVQRLCARNSWKFCFIGGVAVQRWGKPRFTVDVDLTLLTGFGREEWFVDKLLEELEPRRVDAKAFAVTHRLRLARAYASSPVRARISSCIRPSPAAIATGTTSLAYSRDKERSSTGQSFARSSHPCSN
jgi:hypothetical protein